MSSWVQATYHWKGWSEIIFSVQNVPQFPVTSTILMHCFDISEPVPSRGCQELWGCPVSWQQSLPPRVRKTSCWFRSRRPALGQVLHHLRAATSAPSGGSWERRWPELYCIKQHLKLGRTMGGKCSPISSQIAWWCTIPSLLTREAGLLPRKASRQPHG